MYLMDFITIDDRNLLRRFEVRGYPTSFNIPKHNPLSVRVQGIMVVYVSICQNIINNLHGRRLILSPAECAKRYYRSERNILMYLMDFITIDDRNLLRRFEVRGYPTSFNIPKHNPLSVRVQGIMVVYVSICQNIINNLHGRGNSRHFFLTEWCLNRRL